MNNIRPPDELKLSGNVHENWKAFKQSFELYVLAIGLDEREERRRIALLLTVAGRAAVDVFNTFEFPEGDSGKYAKKTVQVVQGGDTTDSEEDGEAFFVGAVEGSESSTTDEWIADLGVNGATIPLKLDTGAQSNGLAEKGVQIIKRLLRKAAEAGEDPYLAVLNYRASPLECGRSPAELLMNRKLKTKLPSAEHLLLSAGQRGPPRENRSKACIRQKVHSPYAHWNEATW
ncbi:hypothetical protein AAFF_G00319790 [Aldrovandia affinis]|uniref:Uncharacterized protein n=1 Tax=Aldrovandia affinis TaxID=143900 RepID=A0AAD7WQB3_9TELE|nr:hypothetical protein AAFF_G00319790 [Aldrovandia affinis]